MWIGGRIGIVIIVESLDIWQGIVGIGGQRTELEREEDWNMEVMGMMDKVI